MILHHLNLHLKIKAIEKCRQDAAFFLFGFSCDWNPHLGLYGALKRREFSKKENSTKRHG